MSELNKIVSCMRQLNRNSNGYIISDLHNLKHALSIKIPKGVDYIVIAGDIVYPFEIFQLLEKYQIPVIAALGNHDYWDESEDFDEAVDRYKKIASNFKNIHVLENETLTFGEIRFIGTTLWHSCHKLHPRLVIEAANNLNDYNFIQAKKWWANKENLNFAGQLYDHLLFESRTDTAIENLLEINNWIQIMMESKKFHPIIAYQLHQKALEFLTSELDKPFNGITVVVSHHPPIYEYLRRQFSDNDEINPDKYRGLALRPGSYSYNGYDAEPYRLAAYGNPLEHMFVRKSYMRKLNGKFWERDGRFSGVDMWIYGHLHHSADFGFYGTRFISNAQYSYSFNESESIFKVTDGLKNDIKSAVTNTCLRIQQTVQKLESFAKCDELESLQTSLLKKVIASKIIELSSNVENEILKFSERFVRITGISLPSRENDSFHHIADDVLQCSARLKPVIGEISLKQNLISGLISVINSASEFQEKMAWTKLPRNFENNRDELDRKGRIFNRFHDRQLIDNQILFDYCIQKKVDGDYISGRSLERGCWVIPEKITYLDLETGVGRTVCGTMFRVVGKPIKKAYEL
ncbi:metallophosphoesterase [Methylophaga sp.]|uniref:metallophosphoesterase n=1 Tax=Methylophaga sp. TaxID=2024840 RepID=UPI003F72AA83